MTAEGTHCPICRQWMAIADREVFGMLEPSPIGMPERGAARVIEHLDRCHTDFVARGMRMAGPAPLTHEGDILKAKAATFHYVWFCWCGHEEREAEAMLEHLGGIEGIAHHYAEFRLTGRSV